MKLQHLAPILWTKDLDKTISFYVNILGFTCRSNFPNFASLQRDNVEIMIVLPTEEPEDCKDPNEKQEFFPKPILTGSIYITIDNVDELWTKIKDSVNVLTPLENREYFMRDFSITDNNGYELVFGQNINSNAN
jgi:catechol 2,3-dioxygenase-like lactoylglutathione lyase family enzyme